MARTSFFLEDAEDILVEVFVAALENKRFLALSERNSRHGSGEWPATKWLMSPACNSPAKCTISALDEAMFEHEAANPEQVSMRQVGG